MGSVNNAIMQLRKKMRPVRRWGNFIIRIVSAVRNATDPCEAGPSTMSMGRFIVKKIISTVDFSIRLSGALLAVI